MDARTHTSKYSTSYRCCKCKRQFGSVSCVIVIISTQAWHILLRPTCSNLFGVVPHDEQATNRQIFQIKVIFFCKLQQTFDILSLWRQVEVQEFIAKFQLFPFEMRPFFSREKKEDP